MSDVVDLNSRRQPQNPNLVCECGSQWWVPEGVVIEYDGSNPKVTGITGPLACHDCGAEEPL
jgi:hypothetical protein